jgi:hypothetical protein
VRPFQTTSLLFLWADFDLDPGDETPKSSYVRFDDFTAVTMKNGVFWDVTWYFFEACFGC